MLKLNFGKSEYLTFRPIGAEKDEPDMVVDIPESGILPKIPDYLLKEFKAFGDASTNTAIIAPRESRQEYTVVKFSLMREEFDIVNIPWAKSPCVAQGR